MNTGHWVLANNIQWRENVFGFVYQITNTVTKKFYIGKKQCTRRVKKNPLKGKLRKRIEDKESDWKFYTGSSNELQKDIEKFGKEKFLFTILKLCDSKWELSYFEAKEQISKNVLLTEMSYNGILNLRIGKAPKAFINNIKHAPE